MTTTKQSNKSNTDWERLQNMDDDDIDTSDSPEPSEMAWANAIIGNPLKKRLISVRLDSDVIDWFKSGGPNYQTRMNQVACLHGILPEAILEKQQKTIG